jgi:small subunit ribosomal protein S4e
MHRSRQTIARKIPILRKGTKYIAVARSHPDNAVPVVIAIRDMLHLAKTAKEVREMIKQKTLAVNGRTVVELNESIQLFHTLKADKLYQLTLSPAGRFTFTETKGKERLAKITGKSLVGKGKLQFHLHDGTNILGKADYAINDSLYLDATNKAAKHIPLAKGTSILTIAGKHMGKQGKVSAREGNVCTVTFDDGEAQVRADLVVAQ